MKRILLFTLVLSFAISTIAQRVAAPQNLRDQAAPKVKATAETMNFDHKVLPANTNASKLLPTEALMGATRYDLQSNSSMQNRIYKFDDGTIAGVYTLGFADPGFSTDRGTGYNYYDGTSWGPTPTAKVEPTRTGWPAYAPLGENGEIFVSHIGTTVGLQIGQRADKGTGDWQFSTFAGPPEVAELLWPRMTTGGVDHSVIHMLPITAPVANGGAVYEGVDGAMVYSRSSDGGATWDISNALLDDINADYYLFGSGDTYEIQAQGDNVAFLFGDSFTDLCLMKSTDGGDNWDKTVIWECPYPLWDPNNMFVTDTFYCSDGAHALAFGPDGKVHVAFGINRAQSDGAGTFWFPLVDGLGYWNEDRPTFSNTMDALNPYGDAGSELVEDYSLVGWAQDLDNNGVWDILGEVGTYYMGTSSMPSITVDDQNQVFIVYASITETYNNGVQDYRHLWARASTNGGDWWGPFVDLTGDIVHIFDECVFPSLSSTSDDYLYLNYQLDSEPGLAVRGDLDPYGDNKINFMKVPKADLLSGVKERSAINNLEVTQNQPNPFNGTSTVSVNVHHASNLSLEVSNMMGQIVYSYDAGQVNPGMTTLTIDGSKLSKGVYFYTVRAGEAAVTRKMIVE